MPFHSKAWFGATVLIAVGLGAAATTSYVVPDVPMIFQSQSYWCWAAADNMVLRRLGVWHRQCNSADTASSQSICGIPRPAGHCCENTPSCNLGCTPRIQSFNANASDSYKTTWDIYKSEITKDQPVIFVWNWVTGGSHVMVGKGFFRYGGYDWVLANDPLRGEVSYPFPEFLDRVGTFWRNIKN